MKNNQNIKKLLAALLLLVFCFSITPKEYLHDWLANHKDFQFSYDYQKSHKDGLQHISKSFYNCHCDNLVVEAPFINDAEQETFSHLLEFITSSQKPSTFYFSIPRAYFNLRGPPQLI